MLSAARLAIPAAVLLLSPSLALAEPYVGLYAGANFLTNSDNSGGTPFVIGAGIPNIESEFDPGFAVGGVVGYGIKSVFQARVELDLSYRRNGIDDLVIDEDGGLGAVLGVGSLDGVSLSDAGADVDGTASVFAALANYWLDIPTETAVTPYVGGGIGIAHISLSEIEVDNVEIVDDSATVFAYQLGAGVSWAFTPSIDISLDYRYFATADPEFEDAGGADFESEYSSHNAIIGLRYRY